MEKKKWFGTWPLTCNLCNRPIDPEVKFFVDGVIAEGPHRGRWGIMCPGCFGVMGAGLGTGVGQAYNTQTREKIDFIRETK